jgi:hypothetical protein
MADNEQKSGTLETRPSETLDAMTTPTGAPATAPATAQPATAPATAQPATSPGTTPATSGGTPSTGDHGEDEVQETVDQEEEQGYRGTKADPTPDENYSVAGVLAGKPTPETDADAKAEAEKHQPLP